MEKNPFAGYFDTPGNQGGTISESKNPFAGYFDEPKEPSSLGGEFTQGVARGIDQLQSSAYGFAGLAGAGVGSEKLKGWGVEGYKRNIEEAKEHPKTIEFKDLSIEEPAKAGRWAIGTLGELVPSMAEAALISAGGAVVGSAASPGPGTAVGVVGGFLGRGAAKRMMATAMESYIAKGFAKEAAETLARKEVAKVAQTELVKAGMRSAGAKAGIVAGVMPLEAGGNWAEVLQETGVDNPVSALATGTAAAFLELAGGNSRWVGKVLGTPAEKAFNKALSVGDTHLVARIAKEAAISSGGEYAQEAGQEFLSLVNTAINDPKFEMYSEKNLQRLNESGWSGAVGGFAGGVAGGIKSARDSRQSNPVADTLQNDPVEKEIKSLIDSDSELAEMAKKIEVTPTLADVSMGDKAPLAGSGTLIQPPPSLGVGDVGGAVQGSGTGMEALGGLDTTTPSPGVVTPTADIVPGLSPINTPVADVVPAAPPVARPPIAVAPIADLGPKIGAEGSLPDLSVLPDADVRSLAEEGSPEAIDEIRRREAKSEVKLWQLSREEFAKSQGGDSPYVQQQRDAIVRQAIKRGDPVPDSIRAEYPDLAKAPVAPVPDQAQGNAPSSITPEILRSDINTLFPNFGFFGLTGAKNAKARATLMSKILGRKATQKESGSTAVEKEIMKIAGLKDGRDINGWLRGEQKNVVPVQSTPIENVGSVENKKGIPVKKDVVQGKERPPRRVSAKPGNPMEAIAQEIAKSGGISIGQYADINVQPEGLRGRLGRNPKWGKNQKRRKGVPAPSEHSDEYRQLQKMYPWGLLKTKGRTDLDAIAEEHGYESFDALKNALLDPRQMQQGRKAVTPDGEQVVAAQAEEDNREAEADRIYREQARQAQEEYENERRKELTEKLVELENFGLSEGQTIQGLRDAGFSDEEIGNAYKAILKEEVVRDIEREEAFTEYDPAAVAAELEILLERDRMLFAEAMAEGKPLVSGFLPAPKKQPTVQDFKGKNEAGELPLPETPKTAEAPFSLTAGESEISKGTLADREVQGGLFSRTETKKEQSAPFSDQILKAAKESPSGMLTQFETYLGGTDPSKSMNVPIGKRIALENALSAEVQRNTGKLGGEVIQTGSDRIGKGVFEVIRPYGRLIYTESTGDIRAEQDMQAMDKMSARPAKVKHSGAMLNQTLMKDITNNDTPGTIANETIQNSIDAMFSKPGLKDRRLDIDINSSYSEDGIYETTITVTDNGIGMSTRGVKEFLLTVGGKGKEGESSRGGYGLAKASLLFVPRRTTVTTTKNGITTTVTGNRAQYLGVKGAGTLMIDSVKVGKDVPSGTTFEMTFFANTDDATADNTYALSNYDAEKAFMRYIDEGLYVDDTTITFNNSYGMKDVSKKMPQVSAMKQVFPPEKFSIDGNELTVYYPEDHTEKTPSYGKYKVEIETLNKGLRLFGLDRQDYDINPLWEAPNWKVIVDFKKTTDVRHVNYPFIRNRTQMAFPISRAVSDKINEKIKAINENRYEQNKQDFAEMIRKSPTVNGVRVLIPFTDSAEFDKALELVSDPQNNAMLSSMADIFNSFGALIDKIQGKKIEMVMTVDPTVHGWRSNPKVVGHELYALNPMAITDHLEVDPEYIKIIDAGYDSNTAMASNLTHTMVHEYTHNFASDHYESFTLALSRIYMKMTHGQLARIDEQGRVFYEDHGARIKQLREDLSGMGKGGTRLQDSSKNVQSPSQLDARREENVSGIPAVGERGEVDSALINTVEKLTKNEPRKGYSPEHVVFAYEESTGTTFPYRMLLPAIEKLGTTISFDARKLDNKMAAAAYDPGTNQIIFNDGTIRRSGRPIAKFEEVIAHEALHAIVINLRETNQAAYIEMKGKLNQFLKEVTPHTHKAEYFVQDVMKQITDRNIVDEIVNLAFTNRQFAEWLNSIPAKTGAKESQTLWGKLKEIILNAIGKVSGATKTKLDELHQIMDSVMKIGDTGIGEDISGIPQAEMVDGWHGGQELEGGKFDPKYIGSGQGLSVGHGFYISDLEGVGRYYADLAGRGMYPSEELLRDYFKPGRIVPGYGGNDRVIAFHWNNGNWGAEVKAVDEKGQDKKYERSRIHSTAPTQENLLKVLGKANRNLYKVSIHKGKQPGEYTWLDWDKTVSKDILNKVNGQLEKEFGSSPRPTYTITETIPGISYHVLEDGKRFNSSDTREGAENIRSSREKFWNLDNAKTGQDFYNRLAMIVGYGLGKTKTGAVSEIEAKDASDLLFRAGIGGNRVPVGYFGGEEVKGKYNYVVFDPNAITVEEHTKYGDTPSEDKQGIISTVESKLSGVAEGIISAWKSKVEGYKDEQRRVASKNRDAGIADNINNGRRDEILRERGIRDGRIVDERVQRERQGYGRERWKDVRYSPSFSGTVEFMVAREHFASLGYHAVAVTPVKWNGAVDPDEKIVFIGEATGPQLYYTLSHETSHILAMQGSGAISDIKKAINLNNDQIKSAMSLHGWSEDYTRDEFAAAIVGGMHNKGWLTSDQTENIEAARKESANPAKNATSETKYGAVSPKTAPTSFNAPIQTKMSDFIYTFLDRQIDLRNVVKAIKQATGDIADSLNPDIRERLYAGTVAEKTKQYLETEFTPLLKVMSENKVRIDDFQEYLWFRTARETNAHIASLGEDYLQDGGSGKTEAQISEYYKNLSPMKKAIYDKLALRTDKMLSENRDMIVKYQLESQDTVDKWAATYKHYAPLFREDIEAGLGTGEGFSVTGPASQRRKGSTRPVVDILAHIAEQRERIIARGEKNRIAIALHGLAKLNPNAAFWKIATPKIVDRLSAETGDMVKVVDPAYLNKENVVMSRQLDPKTNKIVQRGVEFNTRNKSAERMGKALKNIDMDDLGPILGISAKVTRFIASMNTQYNPVFGFVNFVRDFQSAMLNLSSTEIAGKQKQVMDHAIPALKAIYYDLRHKGKAGDSKDPYVALWEDFREHGGPTGYRDLFATSADRAKAISNELRLMEPKTIPGKMWKAKESLKAWLSDYNTSMENAIRLSAYKVAIDGGMSKDKAAVLAKNITVDFNKKGQIATQAGALYAFFNASAQGSARMVETLSGPAGRKIIAGGITLGILQTALLAAAGFGDNDPPEFVRERNIIIPTGGKDYVMIPLPLGLHILPNIGRITSELAMGGFKDPMKKGGDLIGTIFESFNPMGSSGLSLQTITPTVIDPFAAIATNKDWTGKQIYRPNFSSLAPTPGFTRTKDTATAQAKAIAWGLNRISGGTDYSPGMFSPTADEIDYLFGQVTGGVGREAGKVQQVAQSLASGEELPPYKIPLVGRFYGSTEGQAQEATRFYSNLKMLNRHEMELKGRRTNREPVEDYLKENPEARLWSMGHSAESSISRLIERKRTLVKREADPASIKMLDNAIASRMKSFNARILAAENG